MLSLFRGRQKQDDERSGRSGSSGKESPAANDDDEIHELRDASELSPLNSHVEGPTLLWSPVAKIVTGATGVGSFYIRAGTKIGGWGVAAGREATMKSLEMSRAVVETVLLAAGKDVASRRNGELGRAEAESMLERSITMLHSAISTASFVTALGFQSTQAIMNSASTVSIQGLSTLNAVLGSTESSRAVAAIVTLIRRELNRPDAETGETATYLDLLAGTVAFVLLQRWGRRKTAIEFREAGGEELIWDVVIDDKGFRADVVGTNKKGNLTASKSFTRARSSRGNGNDDDSAMMLEKGLDIGSASIDLSAQEQTNLSDAEIRDRIMSQLPPGTRATITTDTMTLKKVTVEIHEGETAYIEPPPGLTMVSESLSHGEDVATNRTLPQQTVVFRTSLTRTSSAEIEPLDKLRITSTTDSFLDNADDDVMMLNPALGRRLTNEMDRSTTLDALDIPDREKPLPKTPVEDRGLLANVKRSRKPLIQHGAFSDSLAGQLSEQKPRQERDLARVEPEGLFKRALRSLSPHHSSVDLQSPDSASSSWHMTPIEPKPSTLHRPDTASNGYKRVYPMPMSPEAAPFSSSRGLSPAPREPATSYFAMHEKKRESTISQTDTFSIHSSESRPSSPSHFRTHGRSISNISKTKSHTEMSLQPSNHGRESQDGRHHQRSRSFVPSLYSMATKNSDEAIILAPKTPMHESIFEDHKMLIALSTDGIVPGMFPKQHFVKVIRRFARFATASYGNNFLRVMGLWNSEPVVKNSELDVDVHHEHNSFSTHTGLPSDCIILSSFFDSSGTTGSMHAQQGVISPLVHFVSADHDQKAIVLTCRGTLGFEDVLTDMTCDYDNLHWRGQTYHVHKGIHAAARRLLSPLGNRVMSSIKQNLEKYPDYGLVMCGHSLGGAVAAIIAILISEPCNDQSGDAAFITTSMPKLLTSSSHAKSSPFVSLPAGRPVHAFAFGSPATVSSALRLATRGLITTIINSNDIVPSLSLGSLHDVRSVALHLKKDTNGHLVQLRSRVLNRVRDAFYSAMRADGTRFKGPPPPGNIAGEGLGEDTWAWTELTSLRSCMKGEKLLPPGECFIIDTSRVFDRLDPEEGASSTGAADEVGPEAQYFRTLGRAATRVQLKLVRDVEKRFSEVRFGSNMFGDHSPGRYEAALSALEKGVCEE